MSISIISTSVQLGELNPGDTFKYLMCIYRINNRRGNNGDKVWIEADFLGTSMTNATYTPNLTNMTRVCRFWSTLDVVKVQLEQDNTLNES